MKFVYTGNVLGDRIDDVRTYVLILRLEDVASISCSYWPGYQQFLVVELISSLKKLISQQEKVVST